MPDRLWVVPCNDLESVEILELLAAKGESVLKTSLGWGVSWADLESPIVDDIKRRRADEPQLLVYGIELAGPNDFHAFDIDHHKYSTCDRSHPESSLEQVARILGHSLTRDQKLVALNDREWIPGMKGQNPEPTDSEIRDIRLRDRRAQGISKADEERAREDLKRAEKKGELLIIDADPRPISAHFDFAFLEHGASEILVRSQLQWQYSGRKHRILESLSFAERHWSGGGFSRGYFGIQQPGDDARVKIRQVLESAGADLTEVEYIDIVLHWPFRIQPLGKLHSDRKNPEEAPHVWLKSYSDWICGHHAGPWVDQTGVSAPSPQQQDKLEAYTEFVYFHPFVQDLLFPRDTSKPVIRTLSRNDIQSLHIGLRYDDWDNNLRDSVLELDLPVDDVRLHLFLTDVAILTLRLRVPYSLYLNRALDLLNQIRRVSVPYWGEKLAGDPNNAANDRRSPGQSPLHAYWVFNTASGTADGKEGVTDCADPHQMTEFWTRYHRPPIMPHWRKLLQPLRPLANQSCLPHRDCAGEQNDLLVQQLGDERMFIAASVIVRDPAKLSDAQWMRLAFVDEGGGGWAYSKQFLIDSNASANHFYDRFWDSDTIKTRYLITGYSFLQVMDNNAFTFKVLRKHLHRHYQDLCLLALIQKFSVLVFRHRLAEALQHYQDQSGSQARHTFHEALQWISADYSSYAAIYEFTEVSNQLQAMELFEKLRSHLHIERLNQDFHRQLAFAADVEKSNYAEWLQKSANFWAPVIVCLTALGISICWDQTTNGLVWLFDPNRQWDKFSWPHIAATLAEFVIAASALCTSIRVFRWKEDSLLRTPTRQKPRASASDLPKKP